ncbi:MAG TPA: hypothetical protein DF383_00760 [Deltaproteobacteria bacterium]|nr:hypothetical protein [Deltaproteobacteria bacterium]
MPLRRVLLKNFRNIEAQDWELKLGLNVLEGENAQGKTNFLEALYYLANGKSFRIPDTSSLIRFGEGQAELSAEVLQSDLTKQLLVKLRPELREFYLQGKPLSRLAPVQECLRVLVFTPDSSALFRGAAGIRRRYFDHAIAVHRPAYGPLLSRYQRILRQRNQLLESGGPAELEAGFELQWQESAWALMQERAAYLQELRDPWRRNWRALCGEDWPLEMAWEGPLYHNGPPSLENLRAALEKVRAEERRRGRSLLGPHRDDLTAKLSGHPLREAASQGQQRMLVIALKLAEAELFQARSGMGPVFLLDDLGSELDARHQRRLLEILGEIQAQTVLTTTQRKAYAALSARTFQVKEGRLDHFEG